MDGMAGGSGWEEDEGRVKFWPPLLIHILRLLLSPNFASLGLSPWKVTWHLNTTIKWVEITIRVSI